MDFPNSRPYVFPVVMFSGAGTIPVHVPKGYYFRLYEIRVIASEIEKTNVRINSTARSVEFFPVPVPAVLLSTRAKKRGSIVSVIKKDVMFSDADTIMVEVTETIEPVKIALCGELLKEGN